MPANPLQLQTLPLLAWMHCDRSFFINKGTSHGSSCQQQRRAYQGQLESYRLHCQGWEALQGGDFGRRSES